MQNHKIWWSNALFFVAVHVAACVGVYRYPPASVPPATLLLSFTLFQVVELSITVGYHRLYSHRAFRATLPVRALLAAVGASGMQGSIKWWCLRHRLHHRFTDDPLHDPYAATKGLLWSHMGWIFFKPRYERLELIDREDLENDPVVRFQHRYYVPLALIFGMLLPPLIGAMWKDACGAFVWGSLVAKLLVWHCTFFVNSLAHWHGLQPYSDENTSRSNFIVALLTCGEGNHNFHAFPHDYRSGPSKYDWDPSKWVILALHAAGSVWGLKRASAEEVANARRNIIQKVNQHGERIPETDIVLDSNEWTGVTWTWAEVEDYIEGGRKFGRCVLIIEGFVVEVTSYLQEHPGGAKLLRSYSIRNPENRIHAKDSRVEEQWERADWAFNGGLNVHTRFAKKRMRELRVAKLAERGCETIAQ
ncbi:uncharacterized protein LAESUDRAFT_735865 [Laetiporus sulphureus 93-53]|uniref:Acyl-CoA desaturase n=1 Tax=Laetiporus sulphureus 93-53 TaxID=1314785 RepID=A0A165FBM9_9APHY|nr:uncharacterized protein LAESUDRAFT_735865 [Laetiporus sulphureus 93-53]KZT08723.1 hypothetical protein LAESUDRAFT_735865 [Laetiporus sulphureus 93-53]